MKKTIMLCLLSSIPYLAHSQTCPPADQLFVAKNGRTELALPSGWLLEVDERSPSATMLYFTLAAWGDHRRINNPVRCHYFQDQNHVMIETEVLLPESKITSHPQWGAVGERYYLCNSLDVNACPFN